MKRFWKAVTVEQRDGGWQVLLDGRAVKTQGGNQQVVPSNTLAHVLAAEWADQGEEIDPALYLFRDHADFAIDVVRTDREAAIDKLLSFAETDTLCYRADPDEPLHAKQMDVWEPLLAHLEDRLGVRFKRVSGVIHKPQPPETVARLREHLAELDDFTLAGMTAMASLSASLAVALLANDDAINDPMALWRDANLEEEWQADLWGREEEAEARRARKGEEFSAAQVFVTLAAA